MNFGQVCMECGKPLIKGQTKMKLMNGPRGFRQYLVCDKCAGKTPLSVNTPTSPHFQKQKMGGEERKAGV